MIQYKDLTHISNAIIDEDTGKKLNYQQFINHTKYKKTCKRSFAKELRRLAQGSGGRVDGTATIFFIAKYQVPKYLIKYVTYGRIVVDYRPQKQEPRRTRLTVGGTLKIFARDVSTPTAHITTTKLVINSTISKPGARYMFCDIKKSTWEYQLVNMSTSNFQLISYQRKSSKNITSWA